MDLDRFLQDWSCHDVADPPPLAAPVLPLTDVLPVGQMPTNIPESESAWRLLRLMGVDPRSAISAVLAAGIRPFTPAEVYRASCDGLVFETTSEHLRRVGHACDLKRAFLQELLGGVPHTGGRRVGHCELHPWQAAVAANIMETRSNNGSMLVELRQDVAQHSVKVELCVPQRAAVLHAATGTGKTYVACMLAMGKTTYCITHQNTPLQWQKEAAKVGLNATWVREAKLLPACVASLESDPKQMLIFSHGLLKNHRFKQVELPKAEFLIVDEVHTIDCNNSVTDFVWLQRDAFRLGMTATIQTDEQRENIANLMMLPRGGLDAATIKLPESANTAVYPEVDFQVRRAQLSSLERSAYDVSRRIDSRNAQVRAMLFPSAGGDDLNYCQRMWKNIAENFAHANRRIRDGLAKILTRARRAPEHEETLKEHLGQEATEQIFEKVRAEEPPEIGRASCRERV